VADRLITPVILSGGAGTRLWPMSRRRFPKQFLPLAGECTMLQETAMRVDAAQRFTAPLIVCNEEHRFIVAEQIRAQELELQTIMLEPIGRNTAPAIAAAALRLLEADPDALMLVLPSDHVVQNVMAFRCAATIAGDAADQGHLVTFGIKPGGPETGFGYIEAGEPIVGEDAVRRVKAFVEKPDRPTAERYVAGGNHFWNSGMFVFRADTLIGELERLSPDIVTACRAALDKAERDTDFVRLNKDAFAAAPSISIDYAVMERTDRAAMVPVDMGWSDVGSWQALWEIGGKDHAGNVVVGDVVQIGAGNCYLRGDGVLVAAIGLEDFIVIATKDAVLVAPKGESQEVRQIVDALAEKRRREVELPAES
jgi:mannose-1-phosphate guanylyltransferase/mannose-1-phosphate guanylyltransferase/mannose-6-phosphate isomerase